MARITTRVWMVMMMVLSEALKLGIRSKRADVALFVCLESS